MLIEESVQIRIDNRLHNATWLRFETSDGPVLQDLYNQWRNLSQAMRRFHARAVNFPEGISESLFALNFESPRIIEVQGNTSVSFDCFNPQTSSRIQVKATSVADDLTSFGPRSVWDELYFMDFFSNNALDGSCDVYLIPNDLIINFQINATQTFHDQQLAGKRPRLHMKRSIIEPNNLRPIRQITI